MFSLFEKEFYFFTTKLSLEDSLNILKASGLKYESARKWLGIQFKVKYRTQSDKAKLVEELKRLDHYDRDIYIYA